MNPDNKSFIQPQPADSNGSSKGSRTPILADDWKNVIDCDSFAGSEAELWKCIDDALAKCRADGNKHLLIRAAKYGMLDKIHDRYQCDTYQSRNAPTIIRVKNRRRRPLGGEEERAD